MLNNFKQNYIRIKESAKQKYDKLNPADLKRKISKLQKELIKLNALKQKIGKDLSAGEKAYEYIPR